MLQKPLSISIACQPGPNARYGTGVNQTSEDGYPPM